MRAADACPRVCGLMTVARMTNAERSKRWRTKHPERQRASGQQWRDAHREEVLAYGRAYREAHREDRRAYNREYMHRYRADPEKRAAQLAGTRAWHQAHPERMQELARQYKTRHPAKVRARKRLNNVRWRQRVQGARVAGVLVDPSAIYERDAGVCGICGLPIANKPWSIDHIVPVSRDGLDVPENVQLAHLCCNGWKGGRLPHELTGRPRCCLG